MESDGISCFQQETHLKYLCIATPAVCTVTQAPWLGCQGMICSNFLRQASRRNGNDPCGIPCALHYCWPSRICLTSSSAGTWANCCWFYRKSFSWLAWGSIMAPVKRYQNLDTVNPFLQPLLCSLEGDTSCVCDRSFNGNILRSREGEGAFWWSSLGKLSSNCLCFCSSANIWDLRVGQEMALEWVFCLCWENYVQLSHRNLATGLSCFQDLLVCIFFPFLCSVWKI